MYRNRKAIAIVLVVCNLLVIVTGCGNQIPEMTEEQNSLITEYAAGVLLKYHSDYSGRLVDTSVAPEEKTVISEPPVEESVSDNSATESEVSGETTGEDSVSGNSSEKTEQPMMTMAQVLGADGFDVKYSAYEICDSYPNTEASPEDMFFSMKAGFGNKLLVLKIDITNVGTQEALFNTLDKPDLDCKVIINGDKKQNAYVSMLENDFMAMNHMLQAGQVIQAAVITELPEDEALQITDVKLQIENEGHEAVLSVE